MNSYLKAALEGNLDEYKSIPFWSWNNSLDEKRLVKQIEEMKAEGIGGFIMHARTGLKEEYLGEKWFSCITACLDKAKELGMEGWIYDENGWPSGFVGGKLLEREEFRARFLEYSVGAWDSAAYAKFIEDEKAGFLRVDERVEGVEAYHNVYLRVSPANTDILNPALVDAFIAETHEKYYARYAERFGKELVGFFTDEPQYYRWGTPYTPLAEGYFEDIRDGLIWLFVRDERGYAFRQKYFATLNELYTENFYKKLYDWCRAHNCKLTGHSVEEPALYTQMWGGAAVMPSYEYEDMPAIDCLGRNTIFELAPKQVASVAAQTGKKFILTETFACCGNDVTPQELKGIAESQYFLGVNKTCQHLYPYSMAGRGKTDHPPVFGKHGNWGSAFKIFNDYFTKLGYIIANTDEQVDVAIVHPIRDIWSEYVRAEDYESVKEIEGNFHGLLDELRKHGVTYHLLDERILEKHGKIEGKALRVGERVYDTLLLPKMRTLSASTYRLLQGYGGKLCALSVPEYVDGVKTPVALRGNTTFEELIRGASVGYTCEDCRSILTARKGKIGEFLFIKNLSMKEESHVSLRGVAEEYRALHLEDLREENISNQLTIAANGSVILIKSDGATPTEKRVVRKDITDGFKVTDVTQNYLLIDYAQISKDGVNFSERYPVSGLFERLLREDYKGKITVRQTFTVNAKMPLTLVMERANLDWAKLNGKPVAFKQGDFDVNFLETDITEHIQTGENEFTYSFDFWQHDGVHFALFDPLATESLRNCLYYDTSIEPIYLKGEFTVGEDRSLSKKAGLPALSTDAYKKGYPFFKGIMTVEGSFDWSGEKEVTLGLDGRFLVAELTVNGKPVFLTLDTKKDITPLVKKGKNEVTIRLRSSLRNLFGPHHFKPNPEPMGVGPAHFEMRGWWKDGYPAEYADEYFCVPFGVSKIYLEY